MSVLPIQTVAVIGLGTIGMRWAAVFSHAGLAVRVHDPDPHSWQRYQRAEPALLGELQRLSSRCGSPGQVTYADDLSDALESASFVQENAPENLETKQALMARIDALTPADAIIASSSSALRVTDIQQFAAHPHRIVLGHPFNPVHLMPLVEVVGGEKTSPSVVERAAAFYESIGKKPVVLRQELTGHLALRLMGAMWREAIALVLEGSVSVEDVDRAFRYGPGPKWTLQGSFISNHLGADGMADFLQKYGATYEAIWKDLRNSPVLNERARECLVEQTRAAIGSRSDAALRGARDAGLLEVLETQHRHGA